MTLPIDFAAGTTRFGIPYLFPAQAQKEFFVNAANSLLDVLLHANVLGIADLPPSDPAESEGWIVGSSPEDIWTGRENTLAFWIEGGWRHVSPVPGMRVFDHSTGRSVYFDGAWFTTEAPDAPTGGATIDEEARTTISEIIEILRSNGFFSRN